MLYHGLAVLYGYGAVCLHFYRVLSCAVILYVW